MAEARWAEVSFSVYNFTACLLFYNLVFFSARVVEERGCTLSCWCAIFAGYRGADSEGSVSGC